MALCVPGSWDHREFDAPVRRRIRCGSVRVRLRRADTEAICATVGFDPVHDPSNADRTLLRNRALNDWVGNWLAASPTRLKGEFALVLHPLSHAKDNHAQAEQVLTLLLAELPLKTAVKLAAQISGAPRNKLYEQALRKKTSGDDAH